MLLGRDVTEKFMAPKAALQSRTIYDFSINYSSHRVHLAALPPRLFRHVSSMLSQTKKNGVTCATLLSEISDATTYRPDSTTITIPTGMFAIAELVIKLSFLF